MEFFSNNRVLIGNRVKGTRSDCHVTMELTEDGGIQLELISKVESMFGDDIRRLINDILSFYGISNARLLFEDTGALSLVIAARMEAAIRQLTGNDREYLLPMLTENNYETTRDRNRISRLYLPEYT